MRKKKSGKLGWGLIALAVGVGGLALAGTAKADDEKPDPDPEPENEFCPEGFHQEPNPAQPNGPPICVADPIPEEPPPKVPDAGHAKNYVGSGYNWPHKDKFPSEASFGAWLFTHGYPAGATLPTQPGWNVISGAMLTVVREFQRDYNAARLGQTVDDPPPKKLDTDGLIGANTIAAMINVDRWMNVLNLTWLDIVELSPE